MRFISWTVPHQDENAAPVCMFLSFCTHRAITAAWLRFSSHIAAHVSNAAAMAPIVSFIVHRFMTIFIRLVLCHIAFHASRTDATSWFIRRCTILVATFACHFSFSASASACRLPSALPSSWLSDPTCWNLASSCSCNFRTSS